MTLVVLDLIATAGLRDPIAKGSFSKRLGRDPNRAKCG